MRMLNASRVTEREERANLSLNSPFEEIIMTGVAPVK